jgi:putative membrane protein
MGRTARWGFALALLSLSAATGMVEAQSNLPIGQKPAEQADQAKTASSTLSPVDVNFIGQANFGAPFQTDSGRLAERKGTTPAIRHYAHLMVVTHIPVTDALNAILERKGVKPPATLLQAAYETMISTLESEHGASFDRDYITGQVDYQKANAALFQNEIDNGSDPDLKAFARETLPKIEDHLHRALKLAATRGTAEAAR